MWSSVDDDDDDDVNVIMTAAVAAAADGWLLAVCDSVVSFLYQQQ